MQPRRRNARPAERDRRTRANPLHSTGPARRRWPRAYDGGELVDVQRRYRRVYDGDPHAGQPTGLRRRASLDTLRHSPIRNGLIGLAVVGAATPLAVNRYQQALRNDPAHERVAVNAATAADTSASDDAVSAVWNQMATKASAAEGQREATIQEKVDQYAEFGLTREMAEDIYDIAVESDVDPDVAFGLVRAESSFKNVATSRVGAVGLTQLMPKTAAWLSPGTSVKELRNPETNLRIGFRYLNQLTEKYDGNETLALTAYNRGPGTVDRVLKRGGNPDNGYASFVRSGNVGKHRG